MAATKGRRVLKPGADNVFVNSGSLRHHSSWRLEVGEGANSKKDLFSKKNRSFAGGGVRSRLFHYIAAGGLRQLRRTSADDDQDVRCRSFLIFLGF